MYGLFGVVIRPGRWMKTRVSKLLNKKKQPITIEFEGSNSKRENSIGLFGKYSLSIHGVSSRSELLPGWPLFETKTMGLGVFGILRTKAVQIPQGRARHVSWVVVGAAQGTPRPVEGLYAGLAEYVPAGQFGAGRGPPVK